MAGRLMFATILGLVVLRAAASGQVAVSGRVADETGAGVSGVRVALQLSAGGPVTASSSDAAGNFTLNAPGSGAYDIRAERQGFYVFKSPVQIPAVRSFQLTITLNHQQEFSDRIDVSASPPGIDPSQSADRKEIDNTEMLAVPYAAPQDYRNALQLFDGVVQDNLGRFHFNGGAENQTNYTLDGFNLSNPVTGQLDARLNIDSIQAMVVSSSRFAAENGRGSAGVVDIASKMGDDHLRFSGTNFIPGFSTANGLHVDKWTPRLELSGPIAKGRAWFANGLDAFYSVDTIEGLPRGQDRTRSLTLSDLSRVRIDLAPSNILTLGLLANVMENSFLGLSFLEPAATTTNGRETLVMTTVRDQQYFLGGALLEGGFADTRGLLRNTPQGDQLYQITPDGALGNYFVSLDRHFYRQQGLANLFLPALHWHGTHLVKFGIDIEREAFHEQTGRNPYEVLYADGSVARYVGFSGSPFQAGHNFEGAQYIQDHWSPAEGLTIDAGLRAEWNEIVRQLELAPRLAAAWAPAALHGTKLSAGWGVYYDALNLQLVTQPQDQISLSTFYPVGGAPVGPVQSQFTVDPGSLKTPYFHVASVAAEKKLPGNLFARIELMRRYGGHGFSFDPVAEGGGPLFYTPTTFLLRNSGQDRYQAATLSVKRGFAGKFEWSAGYTLSSAHTNQAVDYSLENPIFAPQMAGPLAWNAPNRFHFWGWAPVPKRWLPPRLQFLIGDTAVEYLGEFHTGLPFNVVDEEGFLVGPVGSMRLPNYFNLNLHLERKFHAIHYLWAWRCGFDNLTNNGNANTVNNVIGTASFLTFGRGQARAFTVRLRLLGRK